MKTRLIELPVLTDISSREAIKDVLPEAGYDTNFVYEGEVYYYTGFDDDNFCSKSHSFNADFLPESSKVVDVSEYQNKISQLETENYFLSEKLIRVERESSNKLSEDLLLKAIAAANGKILK